MEEDQDSTDFQAQKDEGRGQPETELKITPGTYRIDEHGMYHPAIDWGSVVSPVTVNHH